MINQAITRLYFYLRTDKGEFLATVFLAVSVLLAAGLVMVAVNAFITKANAGINGVSFAGPGTN